MNRLVVTACVMACAAVLGGCAGGGGKPAAAVMEVKDPVLAPVAKLAGDWYKKDENGKEQLAMQMRVTSGGTAVREVMFPGEGHEMTNVYHRDGNDLLVTHYCAMGNQPRMRSHGLNNGKIEFKFDSITNKQPGQEYMGQMTLNITGPDMLVQEWWSIKDGKTEEGPKIKLYRKAGQAMNGAREGSPAGMLASRDPTASPGR